MYDVEINITDKNDREIYHLVRTLLEGLKTLKGVDWFGLRDGDILVLNLRISTYNNAASAKNHLENKDDTV